MTPAPQGMDIPDISLPMKFIFSGISLFCVAQISAISTIAQLTTGSASYPSVLATVHLLILGWAVMVAMGALYQLAPVALQVPVANLPLAHWQFGVYLVGVLGLAASFWFFSPVHLSFFASLTVIGILLFAANMLPAVHSARPSEIRTAVYGAICALLITVFLGLWMAVDFAFPHLGIWHTRLLHAHIVLGTLGWFSLLIVGISYKLLPMFSLSHRYESPSAAWSVWLLIAGSGVAALGYLFPWLSYLTWVGFLLAAAALVYFARQARRILKHRMRKSLDLGVQVSLLALPFTAILLLLTVVLGQVSGEISTIAIVYSVLYGWISLSILGYLFKIIPFLCWTAKYSTRIGTSQVPKLKEMVNESRAKVLFLLFFFCFFTTGIGLSLAFRPLLLTSLLAALPLSLWYLVESLLVLRK